MRMKSYRENPDGEENAGATKQVEREISTLQAMKIYTPRTDASNLFLVLMSPPAGGKSKWIADNNLQKHTVCPDDLRLLFAPDISKGISQKYNKQVWDLHYQIIAARVSDGERLIVADACHTRESYFNRYKQIIEENNGNYSIVAVSFLHDLSFHVYYNERRPKYKVVPVDVIKRMHKNAQILLDNNKVWDIASPSEAMEIIKRE